MKIAKWHLFLGFRAKIRKKRGGLVCGFPMCGEVACDKKTEPLILSVTKGV
ncbi:MAG: hypothetical protein ACI36X_03765 [Bacteroidaceae bacterium]